MVNGERLKQFRIAAGYKSLNAFAKASGVSYAVLHGLEKGEGNPTNDTLIKIAGALNRPLADLMDAESAHESGQESWAWFWRSRFSVLPAGELMDMQYIGIERRALWCLQQLLGSRSLPQVADLLDEPASHLTALMAGRDAVSSYLVDKLVQRCEVPKSWLVNGSPPATDDVLGEVLNHPHGGAYLQEIRRAIRNRIHPVLLGRQIDVLIDAIANNKPPTQ